jgi:uncharacterized protein (DUF2147 family)
MRSSEDVLSSWISAWLPATLALPFTLLQRLSIVAFVTVLLSAAAAAATDVTGIWLTEGSEALIRIAPCGGDSICGTITWLREPNDPATGMPKADTKNPDPSRRSQPIVGVRIFYDMKPSGADQWSGKVYSTKDGAVVDGKLSAKSDNEIRIQGCFLAFCGGQNWTRQRAPAHHGKS